MTGKELELYNKPIEPTAIYLPGELIDYREMVNSPLRKKLKEEWFIKYYSGDFDDEI